MPKQTLKQIVSSGKSTISQISGSLENVAGAAGKGGFSLSTGPNGVSISANFNQLLKKKVEGNKVKSPLKDLYENPNVKAPIVFPSDLDNDHYIIFKVMKERRRNRNDTKESSTYQSIVLPIPSNLQIASSAGYSDTKLGIFGGMAAGKINAQDLKNATTSLVDGVLNKVSQAQEAYKTNDADAATQISGLLGPVAVAGAAATIGGSIAGLLALGGTAGDVGAALQVSEGIALNPHLATVFEGVGFRNHQFQYKFMPRNEQESDTIRQMINTFQYYMHPSYIPGGLAFNYPEEFQIEFASTVRPYLYDIGTCVLKDFTVNYNGEGTPLFFDTSGAPVSIEINMSFQETFIVTKNTLEDRYQQSKE